MRCEHVETEFRYVLIPENLLSIFIFNHSIQLKSYFIQIKFVPYHLKSQALPYIPWNVHWLVKNTKEQRFVLCSTHSSRQNQWPKATTSPANIYLMNQKQWQGIRKYQIFAPKRTQWTTNNWKSLWEGRMQSICGIS